MPKVREVMTEKVLTVRPDNTITEMDKLLVSAGVSGAPVVEGEQLVGIVSRADVVRVLLEEQVAALRQMGCDTFQGFLREEPMPQREFEKQFLGLSRAKATRRPRRKRIATR